jgi:ABC-type branched-subunit amino acid transport system ATPase component
LLGTISLRLSGFYLGIVTLGFLLAFQVVLQRGGKITSGYYGATAPPASFFGNDIGPETWAMIAFALAAGSSVLVWSLTRSRIGRAWRAMKHNELAAEFCGIRPLYLKTSAFAVSAALAAAAGVVYAFLQGAVSPQQFGINNSIDQLTYIIVGGIGSVLGSILGPAVLETAPELLRGLGEKRQLFFAVTLLIVLVVAPKGLSGLASSGWNLVRSWLPAFGDPLASPRVPRLVRRLFRDDVASFAPSAAIAAVPVRRPDPERGASNEAIDELTFDQVRVVYGGLVAVDRLTFSVARGSLHGLIGPNGAGKTTAINALTGVARLADGKIWFDGSEFQSRRHGVARTEMVRRGVARTFQTPLAVPDLSALENTLLGLHTQIRGGVLTGSLDIRRVRQDNRRARERARETLARVRFSGDVDAPVAGLALGELRKIELARALVSRPRLLLLDEPTSGLESHAATATINGLRRLQETADEPLTILLVEHNVPLVFAFSDRVTAMDRGTPIITGLPDEVRRDPEVRRSYLGSAMIEVGAASA